MHEKTAFVSGFFAPAMAFAGAVLMLLFKRELEPRRMMIAIIAGPIFAALLTPSAVAWLQSIAAWLPSDGTVHGAVGCLIGMLAINMVAVVANLGVRAETAAPDMLSKGKPDA